MKGLKTLTIAIDDTDYSKWDREEHWSVHQQVDWNSPLQELQVRQGDDHWGFKNDTRVLAENGAFLSIVQSTNVEVRKNQLHLWWFRGLLGRR
jgi:hypothetical protein